MESSAGEDPKAPPEASFEPAGDGTVAKRAQFAARVFPAELREIAKRREKLGLPPLPEGETPSTALGLVGLALSGGGIRSASFCLGVVQRLAAAGGLGLFDYVSSVSGGGYIGACLSSLLGDPATDQDPRHAPFPLRKEPGRTEPPALVHLRNGSNYLTPPGAFQLLRVPSVLLRGVVLSLLSLLPYVIVAVIATRLLYDDVFPHVERAGTDLDFLRTSTPFTGALLLFCVLSASYPFVIGFFNRSFSWGRRERFERLIAGGLLVALAALAAWPLSALIHFAVVSVPSVALRRLLLDGHRAADLHGIPALLIVGLIGVAASRSAIVASVVRGVVSAMVGGLGILFPLAMYLGICLWEITPRCEIADPIAAEATTALAEGRVTPALGEAMRELVDVKGAEPPTEGIIRVPDEAAHGLWDVRTSLGDFRIHRARNGVIVKPSKESDPGARLLLLVGLILLVMNLRFLDVNMTSPHGFFRDRLSRLFLFRVSGERVTPNDDLRLSELNERPSAAAPYHLINATLNLRGSADRELRGRDADVFLFSKLFVGSDRTGYEHTRTMEEADGHLNLGTAMAISAAAASPQMGALAETRGFSALLTLANARLSYWLPNPDPARRRSIRARMHLGPGPQYLLKEALGTSDETHRFVNVSDGGHVENLGVYQLLRRRCRTIVAIDGEEDRKLAFGGLITLLRYAWIDMGVKIDIDLDAVRLCAEGTSKQHWAIGTIDYGEGEAPGVLVYIKATTTGKEGEIIRDYRGRMPAFPHEPTADQFFTEMQLEAYRSLGEHIATALWPQRIEDASAFRPPQVGAVVFDGVAPEHVGGMGRRSRGRGLQKTQNPLVTLLRAGVERFSFPRRAPSAARANRRRYGVVERPWKEEQLPWIETLANTVIASDPCQGSAVFHERPPPIRSSPSSLGRGGAPRMKGRREHGKIQPPA